MKYIGLMIIVFVYVFPRIFVPSGQESGMKLHLDYDGTLQLSGESRTGLTAALEGRGRAL